MDFITLLVGVIFASIGGELFVRGVVGIARWARISAGIIGATFAAFATSSPELSVSITSALAGTPQIALGDALGSNVVNIGLILGVALFFGPINSPRDTKKRDFPVALLVPVLLGVLAYDGTLSRSDGVILLGVFAAWLTAMIVDVRRQRSAAAEVLGEAKHGRALFESAAGLAFLITSGVLIVSGAKGIATAYGIDPFIIGATLVAIGTSAPELAVTIIARIRGHDEVGLGTILGSNIFNGLFIVGVASLISPIPVTWQAISIGLMIGFLTTLFVYPIRGNLVERQRGLLLVVVYLIYLGAILRQEFA
ncbi:MAG: sodium:calcium antiporter [Pseudomonadota bacterium]